MVMHWVFVQPVNIRLFIHCYKTQRREGYLCNRQMSGCSHPATKHKEGKGTCATGKCQAVHTLQQNTKKGRVLVQPANVRLFIHCYKTQRREGYLCNR